MNQEQINIKNHILKGISLMEEYEDVEIKILNENIIEYQENGFPQEALKVEIYLIPGEKWKKEFYFTANFSTNIQDFGNTITISLLSMLFKNERKAIERDYKISKILK